MTDEKKNDFGPTPSPHSTDLSGSTPVDPNFDCESQRSSVSERRTWLRRVTDSFRPEPREEEVEEIVTRKLENCPKGYPKLAAFLSSETSFSQYRSFRYLHSRVLLDLQAHIEQLERELDTIDELDVANNQPKRLQSRATDLSSRRDDGTRPRSEVMRELREKLVEYDEMLIKTRDVEAFQKPSARDYRSVRSWFFNEEPLVKREAKFIMQKEDIVSLRSGREWSSFDGWVEHCLKKVDCRLTRKLFCTRELREKTEDSDIYYYSSSRVELFVGLIITFVIFVLLVLPVFGMYRLTSIGQGPHGTFEAIGVLVVFTLLFCAAMSMLTTAKRHELFAASAAYCAVLVVFISNFSGGSNGGGVSGVQ